VNAVEGENEIEKLNEDGVEEVLIFGDVVGHEFELLRTARSWVETVLLSEEEIGDMEGEEFIESGTAFGDNVFDGGLETS